MRVEQLYNIENVLKWQKKESRSDLIDRPVILEMIKNLEPETVLDLGCGPGRWTKEMAEFSKRVVGIDMAPDAIAAAQSINKAENIEYMLGDMHQLDKIFKSGEFDAVSALMSVQYSNHLELLFKQINYTLKPHGNFLFLAPHPFNVLNNKSEWVQYNFQEPVNYFKPFFYRGQIKLTDGDKGEVAGYFHSPEEYINTLIASGFKLIKLEAPKPSEKLLAKHPELKTETEYPVGLIVHGEKVG